jgi:HAD superfamily hydrolase (TIGR01509 family)
MMRFEAVIFDLDGTLLETESMVITASHVAFRHYNLMPRIDILTREIGGVAGNEIAALAAEFGPGFDGAGFAAVWETAILAAFAQGIPVRPGATDLLSHLSAIGMPRAVATNSLTHIARKNLTTAGIHTHFDLAHIHGRDRVDRPKPAPDLFLHAARTLGADPARCLVFEDSDVGTAAAIAAGMTVVQVPDQRLPGTQDAHYITESLLAGARAAGLMP